MNTFETTTFAPFSFCNSASKSSDLPNVLAPSDHVRAVSNSAERNSTPSAKAKLLMDIDFGVISHQVTPSVAQWLVAECVAGDRRFYTETTLPPFQMKYKGWPPTNPQLPFVCFFESLRPMRAPFSTHLVHAFLTRVQSETNSSSDSFVVALVYIQKLARRIEGFYLYSRNISRLLTLAIAAASRYYDDSQCPDSKWVGLRGLDSCDLEVDRDFFSLQQKQFHEMMQGCFEVTSEAFVEMLQQLGIQTHANDTLAFPAVTLELADASPPAYPFPDIGSPKMSPSSSPKLDFSVSGFAFNKSPFFSALSSEPSLAEGFSLFPSMPADSLTFVLPDDAPANMGLDENYDIRDYIAEVPEASASFPSILPSSPMGASPMGAFQASSLSEPSFEAQDPAVLVAQALLEDDDHWADCSDLPDEQPQALALAPPPRPFPIPKFTSISSVDDFRKLPPSKVVRPPSSAFDCSLPEYASFVPLPVPSFSSITRHTWQFARQIAAAQHAQNSQLERLPETDDGFFPNL